MGPVAGSGAVQDLIAGEARFPAGAWIVVTHALFRAGVLTGGALELVWTFVRVVVGGGGLRVTARS
jgi:hypothetical protein